MANIILDNRTSEEGSGLLEKLKSLFRFSGKNTLRGQLEQALDAESGGSVTFSATERQMLRNILGFREVRVDDVMVPRVDIIAVDQTACVNDILAVFKEAGHSRLPLFKETLDEPTGMVHIKDLMGWLTSQAAGRKKSTKTKTAKTPNAKTKSVDETGRAQLNFSQANLEKSLLSIKISRPMMFVPPSMPAIDLLKKMQSTRIHLALVVDEYGGTEGLVSIEDLVEEIVGEIEDEHDLLNAPQISRSEDGSFVADARVLIEDFQELIGTELDFAEADEDIDTLGGLVFSLAGRIPVRGELVSGPMGLEFEILDVDLRRIKKMRIYLKSKSEKRGVAIKSTARKS